MERRCGYVLRALCLKMDKKQRPRSVLRVTIDHLSSIRHNPIKSSGIGLQWYFRVSGAAKAEYNRLTKLNERCLNERS